MYLFIVSGVFQLYWLLAVFGQQHALPLLFTGLTILLLSKKAMVVPVFILAAVGVVGDNLLSFFGILSFSQLTIPLWLVFLWLGFASYVYLIKTILLKKPRAMILAIGTIGGTLSYLAGEKVGSVNFSHSLLFTSIVLSITWFIYTQLFLFILNKFVKDE